MKNPHPFIALIFKNKLTLGCVGNALLWPPRPPAKKKKKKKKKRKENNHPHTHTHTHTHVHVCQIRKHISVLWKFLVFWYFFWFFSHNKDIHLVICLFESFANCYKQTKTKKTKTNLIVCLFVCLFFCFFVGLFIEKRPEFYSEKAFLRPPPNNENHKTFFVSSFFLFFIIIINFY